jgi:hypothetical protein
MKKLLATVAVGFTFTLAACAGSESGADYHTLRIGDSLAKNEDALSEGQRFDFGKSPFNGKVVVTYTFDDQELVFWDGKLARINNPKE